MLTLESIHPHRVEFASAAEQFQQHSSSDQNVFGGFIFGDGSYQQVGKWVCHGFLNSYNLGTVLGRGNNRAKALQYVLSAPMLPHASDKVVTKYYDWLINRSMWAHTHLDKDVERCKEFGFVVDATGPTNIFVSGLIASRFMTESYDTTLKTRIRVRQEILEAGFSEDEAFLFSHLYNSENAKKTYPLSFSPYQSGHSVFFHEDITEVYYRNFLDRVWPNPSGPLINNGRYGYVGSDHTISSLWGKKTDKGDHFMDWASKIRPDSGVKATNYNIFEKLAPVGFNIQNVADLRSVLTKLKERIYA